MQFVSSALIDLGPTSIDSSASSGLGLGPVELAGESSSEDKKEIKFLFALQNYHHMINNSSPTMFWDTHLLNQVIKYNLILPTYS